MVLVNVTGKNPDQTSSTGTMTDPWGERYIYLHENHKYQPFMSVNIPVPWMTNMTMEKQE